ncbi:hypothetical protein [Tsukamurella sp. NPDC003166]|uniref:hypothetical protein n=1 Tax=Tsukamurella sp. NPDC003166 TaxID=3154444 RepID=UPI00339E299D
MTDQEDTPMENETISETTDTEQSPEQTVIEPDAADDGPEPQSKREARYRTQLRDTEAERDKLAATVEAMQRTEVERLAGAVIAKPESLWASGVNLADLLGEDGLVDPDKVNTAAHTAREELGLELGADERKKRGPIVPREGTGTTHTHRADPWKDAFKQE